MILRHATDDDAEALNSFDVGDTSIPWLAEVAEIVAGLLGWRSDPAATDEDRQVVIVERDGELVAVAAHVRLVGADGRPTSGHVIPWNNQDEVSTEAGSTAKPDRGCEPSEPACVFHRRHMLR